MHSVVLNYHFQQLNTAVSQDMRFKLYIDNIIIDSTTKQTVVSYYRKAQSIISTANMNLHSWLSNSVEPKTIAAPDNVNDDSQSMNVVGLRWNPTTDEL